MKKIISIALAAAGLAAAAPAMAAPTFTGIRVEATAGVDDVTKLPEVADITYGAAVGLDAPVFGGKLIVGLEASVDNVFERKDIAGSVRVGTKVADRALVYGKIGYSDFTGLTGVRYGGGVDYAVTDNIYAGVEYRYSDLELGKGRHQSLVKIGFRF